MMQILPCYSGLKGTAVGLSGLLGLLVALPLHADDEETRRPYFNDKQAPDNVRDLLKIQESLQKALPRARKATVGIDMGGGAGSGVIVSADGLILTAAHVSGGVGKELTVIMDDGTRHEATSLGLVATTDAAMMKIDAEGTYPYVELDTEDTAQLGDWVFALGHSGGYDEKRGVGVRIGRLVRVADQTVQSDCNLIGGDSGGPLFDIGGRLIGIHSRVGASLEQNMHVPLREFQRNWEEMKKGEFVGEGPFAQKPEYGHAFLGVELADHEGGGARIEKVVEDSAAAKAELKVDDVITTVDGKEIANREAFLELMKEQAPGFKLKLTVVREEKELEIEVELGKREEKVLPAAGGAFLGVATEDRDGGGVRITEVLEDSAADKAELKVGDAIVSVDGKEIADREAWQALMEEQKPGLTLKLKILRDEEELEIEVELEAR